MFATPLVAAVHKFKVKGHYHINDIHSLWVYNNTQDVTSWCIVTNVRWLAIKVAELADLLHFLSFHTFLSRALSFHCHVLIDHEPKSN